MSQSFSELCALTNGECKRTTRKIVGHGVRSLRHNREPRIFLSGLFWLKSNLTEATQRFFLWCCTVQCGFSFESGDKILRVTFQMKADRALVSYGAVYYPVQDGSNFWVCGWNPKVTEQYFSVVLFIILYKVVLTFESVDEILKCDHSSESYWALLFCGAVYYPVQGGSNF